MPKRTLFLQLCILAVCAVVLTEIIFSFPAPSPLLRPFLPPQVRWPSVEIRHWVETGAYDTSFLEFFARDPDRKIPAGDGLVSPADGRVERVEYRNGKTYVIVRLSFWDVHVVRTPLAGIVESVDQEGTFISRDEARGERHETFFLRGKDAPVQSIVRLETERGMLTVRLITSYWASRLKVWVHAGQHVDKGQRLGRILLGSTVVLELPGKVTLSLKEGQHVTGGETIL